jgi:hypothetical protein
MTFDFELLDDDRVALADAVTPLTWQRQAVTVLLFVAATAILLSVATAPAFILLWGGTGVVASLAGRPIRPYVLRAVFRYRGLHPVTVRIDISDVAIVYRENGLRVEVLWARVRRSIVTADVVVFDYAPLRAIAVPRRVITPEQLERIEAMASRLAGPHATAAAPSSAP